MIKTLALIAILMVVCSIANADSSNGDMSDRGGTSFEELSKPSYDPLGDMLIAEFFGPDWKTRGDPKVPAAPPIVVVPTSPVPEPSTWLMLALGLLILKVVSHER